MSNGTKNMKNVSKKEKISPIYWPGYFWFAFAMGFFGGVCISIAVSDANRWGGLDFFYWIGYGFWIVAAFFSIVLLKEVIAEAGVRAREVYYGKTRAIKPEIKPEIEPESGWSWGE
ncbi:MAG TPA: hypothetical protein DEA31_03810 [Alphaproteobacteria bacterium]|nr:hypothetical protein [Alphaproteobacteria bacterium]